MIPITVADLVQEFAFFQTRLIFFRVPYLQIYIILYCNLYSLIDHENYWAISKHINRVCYHFDLSMEQFSFVVYKHLRHGDLFPANRIF